MSDESTFEVGDLVRLVNGWTALKVAYADADLVVACYGPETYRTARKILKSGGATRLPVESQLSGCTVQARRPEAFAPWDPNEKGLRGPARCRFPEGKEDYVNERLEKTMPQLYTWENGSGSMAVTVYGTKIGKDSQGRWVMEPKGGGSPVAKTEAELTKVVPFTVLLRSLNDEHKNIHAEVAKGAVSVGDVLLLASPAVGLYEVAGLGTQSLNAKVLRGLRIKGDKIGGDDSGDVLD